MLQCLSWQSQKGGEGTEEKWGFYAFPFSILPGSCVAESFLPMPPYSSTELTCLLKKRGIRSIMWPGKLFGTLYYLLCKHITGCRSTFGPGCVLVKHYQDLENQTGCSFSIIAKLTVETETQARGHLRTTGIWPYTSWRARGLVSLQICVIATSSLKNCFEILPTSEAHTVYSIYIYVNAHEILGGCTGCD